MNKHIFSLLIAQFLSAFADNAILFTVISMVMHMHEPPTWYVPALQSVFLVAYVVLAPWVGGFADHHAKATVLVIGNLIKAAGALLLLAKVEPLYAYCIVGAGATIYSPAKYGILPELAGHDQLVKANSWIEGSTIAAILFGMVLGAKLADHSVYLALIVIVLLFFLSASIALFLPKLVARTDITNTSLVEFGQQIAELFVTPRSRFAVLGASLFWATAATLRVILIAWAPLVLSLKTASDISQLTVFLAFGIIAGSVIVPRLITLEHLRRVRFPAFIMAAFIAGLSFSDNLFSARCALFMIGMMGGMFIVPINATLQEIGQQGIGSGGAVALQNFFQNGAMLLGVGAYTIASARQVEPATAMQALAFLLSVLTFFISINLSKKIVMKE